MELVSGLVVGFLLGLGVGWWLGAKQGGSAPARPESPHVPSPSPLPPTGGGGPLQSAAGGTDAPVSVFGNLLTEMLEQSPQQQVADLRQNLRLKCLHDDSAVERLVGQERDRDPSGDEVAWLRAAIKRWENDNR